MIFAADLIDIDALLSVVWVSFAAAVGGTAAFSIAIAGATRFVDMRREGRSVEAGMFAAVVALALLVVLGGLGLGLYEIIKK
jgi:uncharacterized membrane protein